MSSKDKTRFKMFLKSTKSAAGERTLFPEYEKELRPELPIAQRCKMLKELGDLHLHNFNLDETYIAKLWHLTNDLIVLNKPAETRQIALSFYKRLIHTQYKNLTLMREKFFLVIQNHEAHEDLRHLLELLYTLTENGKDITNFEEKIGKFMLLWIPAITDANLLSPYLDMMINLIKFNAAQLDKDILIGIVQNACDLSCTVADDEIGLQCLTVLEMVIGYTIFPSEPLHQCIVTLCRTVNHARYCQSSFKIMKNLLGTQLGYRSMKMMCTILNDQERYDDAQLLRGAVFHLNMNIFGSTIIFQVSPMIYATNVLNGFLSALQSMHVIVTYEVILSVRMVINKHKLSEIIWDLICDIMSAIVDNIEEYERSTSVNKDQLYHLQIHFHENIDCIEKMLQDERAQILCNVDRIYDLIERVADRRPEASVLALIDYRTRHVTATRPEWLFGLTQFVHRYYRMGNANVRIKTIDALVQVMNQNRASYEEEILDHVVVTQLALIHQEPSLLVRTAVARALSNFAAHCDTKRCMELLDMMEALINRPFDEAANGSALKTPADFTDIIECIDGLIEVFDIKLHRLPATHAIKIFNILTDHLEMHYDRPEVFEKASIVRLKIFNWMLKARANASYHIGYPDNGSPDKIKFSHYLGIDSPLPPQTQTTTISIRRACNLIVRCLQHDTDYAVFQLVTKDLPKVLQNKALIQGNDVEKLAHTLFNALENNKFQRPTDEFKGLVLRAIASLVIYHECLAVKTHTGIISALTSCIVTSNTASSNVCINTMTILVLEMPEETMRKTLPYVLCEISRMSDTSIVAIPVLEFLSLLNHLSNHLFTNFTSKHYMYVFAISGSYTKPDRYDHYTVSLAYHVLVGWFLKCKLEMRKNFVKYIKSSLESNLKVVNEDSSNRKRSTSLTERGSKNTATTRIDKIFCNFHTDLAETCYDFLARHTYSPCPSMPKRLPAIEYLLKDGVSQTWLVGHNLVTITTAGCPSGPTRNGLCERCVQLGKTPSISLNSKSLSDASQSQSLLPEAYPRRGSNPEASGGAASTQVEDSHTGSNTSLLVNSLSLSTASVTPSIQSGSVAQQSVCVRACTAWAEIYIRRPTGNISWITRVQNPIANNCFGQDLPFNNIVSMFLPSAYGGVFGPDNPLHVQPPQEVQSEVPDAAAETAEIVPEPVAPSTQVTIPAPAPVTVPADTEIRNRMVARARALQRQEEIHSSMGRSFSGSAAIDIPIARPAGGSRRGKEAALSGSVSDGEADDDAMAFGDGQSRARNPVRRVNSSPEMSSSWRQAFRAAKPAPLSQDPPETIKTSIEEPQLPSKKRSVQYSTKDMRVSCEAIPEEIAGSTPVSQVALALKCPVDAVSGTLPPKQHSADDVSSQVAGVVQTSASASSLKLGAVGKPPLSPGLGQATVAPKQPTTTAAPGTKVTSYGATLGLAKSNSSGNGSHGSDYNNGNGGGDMMRARAKTISVPREVNNGKGGPQPASSFRSFGAAKPSISAKLCMNPSFNFLQLYSTGQVKVQATQTPLKVDPELSSTLALFDLVPPFETHKIGVLYVGRNQCNNEVEILRNSYGSTRYVEFLRSIGTLVSLKEAEQNNLFIGLDKSGADGKFAYIWKNDILQVTFHVATLMPTNLQDDPNCNEKKKHIGNDFVKIIYNESGEEYNLTTISGHFNYACVIVEPLELNSNRVYVKARSEISMYVCHSEPRIVSDRSAPLLARQMALHANLASLVYQTVQTENPYASNWLERFRKIKRLRLQLLEKAKQQSSKEASGKNDSATAKQQNSKEASSKNEGATSKQQGSKEPSGKNESADAISKSRDPKIDLEFDDFTKFA